MLELKVGACTIVFFARILENTYRSCGRAGGSKGPANILSPHSSYSCFWILRLRNDTACSPSRALGTLCSVYCVICVCTAPSALPSRTAPRIDPHEPIRRTLLVSPKCRLRLTLYYVLTSCDLLQNVHPSDGKEYGDLVAERLVKLVRSESLDTRDALHR